MSDHNRLPGPLSLEGSCAENWKRFIQEFEIYLISSEKEGKRDEVKVALLLHCGGRELLDIYNTLPVSEEEKNDYKKLVTSLNLHFEPKKYTTYERYLFNTRTQQPGESIDSFVTDLRKQAKNCNYGTLHDELLRDRVICGITDDTLRSRLLRIDDPSLDEVLKQCRTHEVSEEHLKEFNAAFQSNVNIISKFAKAKARSTKKEGSEPNTDHEVRSCKFCGFQHILNRRFCPAADQECHKCGRRGHFKIKCTFQGQRKPRSKSVRNAYMEQDYSSGSDEYQEKSVGYLCVEKKSSNINYCKSGKKQDLIQLEFPDHHCEFGALIDTGAEVSVLPKKIFDRMKPKPTLGKTKTVLVSFTGDKVTPIGKIWIECLHNSQRYKLVFHIVDIDCKPLLSRNTCELLGVVKFMKQVTAKSAESAVPVSVKLNNLNSLISEYADVFQGLGCIEGKVHLEVDPSVSPVVHSPRKVPVPLRTKLKAELDEMEKNGVIVKESNPTEWVNSMVIVEKGDKLRVCIDPRDLNKALKRQHYPLPTIEEISTRLSNAKVFSVLDATKGFWQLELDETSSKLLTFNTCFGRYRYLRLGFGVSPAPEIYQRRMHEMFDDLEGVEVIMDDILVYGSDEREHDERLKTVLQRCRERNLKLNSNKLKLKTDQVEYIGHVLTPNGLKPDPGKVEVITKFPPPQDKTELLRFMGMVNYLAKFIPRLSDINEPLRRLLEKDADFHWGEEQVQCFEKLKKLVSEAPVLRFYDVRKPVTLTVDSSGYAIGACILQDDKPVAYAATSLTKTQKNYAQIEKELLAIVFGVEKFHSYIYGKSDVVVESDHRPLETIFKKPLSLAPPRLQRMLLRLQKYTLEVKYKKGKEMYVADALSRVNWSEELDQSFDEVNVNVVSMDLNVGTGLKVEVLKQKTKDDHTLQMLKEYTLEGWPDNKNQTPVDIHAYWNFRDEISYSNGLLSKMDRVIVPKELRNKVMRNLHKSHQGIEKTLRLARDLVYWPGMNGEMKDLISSCDACNTFSNQQAKEPLMSHPVPDLPWQKLGADLFELNGKSYLILVDYYSKFMEVDELQTTHASSVVKCCKHQFARHGIPETIHSDNGPQFTAKEFGQFCKFYGIQHTSSSPRYPQSNGLAERSVQTIKKLIRKAIHDGGDLYQSLLDYRNTPIVGDVSPAQLLFGRRTRTTLPTAPVLLKPETQDPVIIKRQLRECQDKQKFYYDQNAKPLIDLKQGDVVRINDGQSKESRKGIVVAPRSYLVKDNFGQIYRRNRRHLIRTEESPPLCKSHELDNEVNIMPSTPQNYNHVSSPKSRVPAQSHTTPVRNPGYPEIHDLPTDQNVTTTRSGRVVRPPSKLDL